MSQRSPALREAADNSLLFWCPGCKESHRVQHGPGTGPRWIWNGDIHKPTFIPGILARISHYAEHSEEDVDFECRICHSFVTDGRIQFLTDSTHTLAGQTVDLPNFPEP